MEGMSQERTREAEQLIQKFGGKLVSIYALLERGIWWLSQRSGCGTGHEASVA